MSTTTATTPTDVGGMTEQEIAAELRTLAQEERTIEGQIDAAAARGDEGTVLRLLTRQRMLSPRRRALQLGDLDRQERAMRAEDRADRLRAEERGPLIGQAQARREVAAAELRAAEEEHQRLIGEADLDRLGMENRIRRRRDLDAQRRLIEHPERAPVPNNVTPIDRDGFGPSRFGGAVNVGDLPA